MKRSKLLSYTLVVAATAPGLALAQVPTPDRAKPLPASTTEPVDAPVPAPRESNPSGFDCNGNGVPDDQDIEDGTSFDFNGNGIPDECDGFLESPYGLEPGTQHTPAAAPCGCGPQAGGAASAVPQSTYLATGEFFVVAEDLRIAGRGMDFVWTRKYRSRFGQNTAIGNGWDYSYNIFIQQNGPDMLLHDGNNREDLYQFDPGRNSWHAEEFFRELLPNPDGSFTLVFSDAGKWHFLPLDGSPAQGKLAGIEDRNGNQLQMQYNPTGLLEVVIDTLGRPIIINYNPDGFIQSLTDFAGRQVTYEYYELPGPDGTLGDLRSVTTPAVVGTPTGNDFPDGKTTVYTYSTGFFDDVLNHNLLTATDPKGQTYLFNEYDSTINPLDVNYDRLIHQTLGNLGLDEIDIVYVPQMPVPHNGNAIMKAIVNDRMGNVKELYFDERNRGVLLREYTGRAPDPAGPTSDFDNRPVGKLRVDDPDWFETQWAFDANSLPVLIVQPNQTVTNNEYDALNPDPRAQGNLLTVTRDPGPLGGDPPAIVEFFEYDPGFSGCCGTNFVIRHVDGRGNETLHEYDDSGNRIHTDHRILGIQEDWEYNEFGQMTAHVYPDNGSGHRRRDEYVYYDSGPMLGYVQDQIVDDTGFGLVTTYEYDIVGNITRVTDPRGNDTQYVVNQLNQIVRETSRPVSPGGTRFERDKFYDGNDNVVRIDVENVDDLGVVQPDTHLTTLYEYDILNYMTRNCAEDGAFEVPADQLSCDGLPDSDFIFTEFEYDANRRRSLTRLGEATTGGDPFNVVTTMYDERDLVFRQTLGAGSADESTTQQDYDGNGNTLRVIQGAEDTPRITTRTYDGYDRLVLTTDAMGNAMTYLYDENDNRVSERVDGELLDVEGDAGNVRLLEIAYVYDDMDRRTLSTAQYFDAETQTPIDDGTAVTETEYTPNSQILIIRNDRGNEMLYTYDTANRRDTIFDPLGNTTTLTYDANSNVIVVTELDKAPPPEADELLVTSFAYDGLDRRTMAVDNAGHVHTFGHDSRSNLTRTTDANGNEIRQSFDGINRLVRRVYDMDGDGADGDDDDIVILKTWDDSSRLLLEIDDNDNTTTYEYDSINRMTRTICSDGTESTHAYDVHHNTVTTTDANGSVVTSTFDLLNRATTRAIVLGADVLGTTGETYAYDGASRIIRATDDDSLVVRAYDSLFNVLEESLTVQVGTSDATSTVTGTYDGVHNRLTETYPGGRLITTTYDELDRRAAISDGDGSIASFDYIGQHRVRVRNLGNNTRTTLTYDPASHVRHMTGTLHTFDPDGTPSTIDQRAYDWDDMFNETRRTNLLTGVTHSREYDSIHRLVRTVVDDDPALTPPVVRDGIYSFDGVHNRLDVTGTPAAGTYVMDSTLPEPADFQVNQYTVTPMDGRLHDANGNLTQRQGQADFDGDGLIGIGDYPPFAACLAGPGILPEGCSDADFDGDNDVDLEDYGLFVNMFGTEVRTSQMRYDYRNQLVEYRAGLDAGPRHTYAYDCFGRRVARTLDADGAADTTAFAYGGQHHTQVVEERDLSENTLATYVYGNYVDEVLSMQRDADGDATPENYYYHADDLFNIVALTGAGGQVVERYAYGDYGEPVFKGDSREPDRDELFDSDLDPAPTVVQLIADSYQLTGNATIRGLIWWGGYSYGAGAPATDNFTVRIYTDDGGLPGTLLVEENLGNVERRPTGLLITSDEGDVDEYAYSAALSMPFTATAATTYWLSVVNDTTGHGTTWGWESSTRGNADLAFQHDGGAWGNFPANTAFELITDASTVRNPYLFQGRRYDDENGFYYYRARYLDPQSGRFITRDPVGTWGDVLNLGSARAFLGNNPWSRLDPSGLKTVNLTGKGSKVISTGIGYVAGVRLTNISGRITWDCTAGTISMGTATVTGFTGGGIGVSSSSSGVSVGLGAGVSATVTNGGVKTYDCKCQPGNRKGTQECLHVYVDVYKTIGIIISVTYHSYTVNIYYCCPCKCPGTVSDACNDSSDRSSCCNTSPTGGGGRQTSQSALASSNRSSATTLTAASERYRVRPTRYGRCISGCHGRGRFSDNYPQRKNRRVIQYIQR